MAKSTAEWEWVVSSKYCKYKATCSKFAGNAQISVLELANSFHLRKVLLQASVVPGALDTTTVAVILNISIKKEKQTKRGRQTKSMNEGI